MRQYLFAISGIFILCSCLLSCDQSSGTKPGKRDEKKFADHVRSTAFQTPEQERAGFTLPEGFEVTLFASEPDISKPMNIAFDDQGRLWVTQSSEYPMAAGFDRGKDRISILEDTDGDGKADKFTHFEDTLNIPIGILPVSDGAIAYSIPNVYRFADTNKDGKADQQKVLLGPFGFKDTHGMVNNFIRGFDGWVHSSHGFTNTSTIAGADGDSITMTSGNTFRFKPDGSRVEQTTFGRVNPFGYSYDEWGYLYSLDCHTKPIYQLIPGGDYPHFGKIAPAGIGFAPEMTSYELGSTALAGLDYYTGEQFPEAYRNSFYSGDVVTCKVNRNTMTFNGATPIAKREEDFLVSNDPWFRPVDVKTGPDGALYIADFYNRIIGHYEVPLNHPGRDRISGRIWKITYTGKEAHKDVKVNDWSKVGLEELLTGLQSEQLTTRFAVANRIADVWKEKAIEPVKKLLTAASPQKVYIQALWILNRLNALPGEQLNEALQHKDPVIKAHALRILTEMNTLSHSYRDMVVQALTDQNPHVRRIAAGVLTKFTNAENVAPLLNLYSKSDEKDSHLRYAALLGVRNNLRDNKEIHKALGMQWDEQQLAILCKVMLDVPSAEAADFVLNYMKNHDMPRQQFIHSFEYAGRYLPSSKVDDAIALIKQRFEKDKDVQFMLYYTIRQGIAQKGAKPSAQMQQWGIGLTKYFIESISEAGDIWKSRPLDSTGEPADPWRVSDEFLTNVAPAFRIIFSEAHGYNPMAVLYSVPFTLPANLQMNIFDNDIHNSDTKKGISKNVVRIRLHGSNEVVAEYRMEQKEAMEFKDLIKEKVPFDLSAWQGKLGYIEVVDSTKTGSVGIGKLEPAVVPIPGQGTNEINERRVQAAEIAGEYKVAALQPALQKIVASEWLNYKVRAAAANALMNIAPGNNAALIGKVLNDETALPALRQKMAAALAQVPSSAVYNTLQKGLTGSSFLVQTAIVSNLSASQMGINHILDAFKEKQFNPAVLTEPSVRERLAANITPTQQKQLDALWGSSKTDVEERQKLIEARIAGVGISTATAEAGKNIFVQNCAMCHQVKGEGGLVGPQLDGIGNWGVKALTEKILDPNRNISQAFRTYNITLQNGKLMSGLYRRTEGEVIVYADPSGKEFSVAKNDIKENKLSQYTLMPDQFRNTIKEEDFYALMKYLLSVK